MHFSYARVASVKQAATLLLAAAGACAALPTFAQQQLPNSIFPAGWDSKVRDRLFMRIGYTAVITKTKSEQVRDVSGPVVTQQELLNAVAIASNCSGSPSSVPAGIDCTPYLGTADYGDATSLWGTDESGFAYQLLASAFRNDGVTSIGTPPGIKAKAQKNIGTPTLSIGYWIDQERKWLLEGFVLAAPLKVDITGDGTNPSGQPNGINGKVIATTKLLPPLVIGSYNFGEANAMFRPYVGVGAMYAVFFGAKASPELEQYVGGPTTITTKNTFGFGPFLGLKTEIGEGWHFNVSVGRIGLQATSRLVTSNTQIRSGSAVLNDLTSGLIDAIKTGDNTIAQTPTNSDFGLLAPNVGDGKTGATTLLMNLVSQAKGQSNLGTFVREQKMKLTNTIINVSVGMNF